MIFWIGALVKSIETFLGRLVPKLALTALIFSQSGAAAPLISDNFTRISPGESITAPFASSAGAPTVGSYSSLIEIIVSGTGSSFGLNQNDAFYCSLSTDERCSASGVVLDFQYYQLNIGIAGLPFVGGEANNIDQFITFIDGVGPVPQGTLPHYDAVGHEYHFVANLPIAAASTLRFGVSESIYFDNDGSFEIQVYQIAASAVPEPHSLVLILTMFGFSLLFGLHRTRACTGQSNAALRLLSPARDTQR